MKELEKIIEALKNNELEYKKLKNLFNSEPILKKSLERDLRNVEVNSFLLSQKLSKDKLMRLINDFFEDNFLIPSAKFIEKIDIYRVIDKIEVSYGLIKKLLEDNNLDILVEKLKKRKLFSSGRIIIKVLEKENFSNEFKKKIALKLFEELKDLSFVGYMLENDYIDKDKAKELTKSALILSDIKKFAKLVKRLNYKDYKEWVIKIESESNVSTSKELSINIDKNMNININDNIYRLNFIVKKKKNSNLKEEIPISIHNIKDLYNITKENKLDLDWIIVSKLKSKIDYKKALELADTEDKKTIIRVIYQKLDEIPNNEFIRILESLKNFKIDHKELKNFFIKEVLVRLDNSDFLNNSLFLLWPSWVLNSIWSELMKLINTDRFKKIIKTNFVRYQNHSIFSIIINNLVDKKIAISAYKETKNPLSLIFSNFSIEEIIFNKNIDNEHKFSLIIHFVAKEIANENQSIHYFSREDYLNKINKKISELNGLIRSIEIDQTKYNFLNDILNSIIEIYLEKYYSISDISKELDFKINRYLETNIKLTNYLLSKSLIKLDKTPYYYIIGSKDDIIQFLDSNSISQNIKETLLIAYSLKSKFDRFVYDLILKTKSFVCSETVLELIIKNDNSLKKINKIMALRIFKPKNLSKKKII